jgi:hypothetical protein
LKIDFPDGPVWSEIHFLERNPHQSALFFGSGKLFKKAEHRTNRLIESMSPGRGNFPPKYLYRGKFAIWTE